MPSALHEALVQLFRSRPSLAGRLLREVFGVSVPRFTEARVESAELTHVEPAEYRADLVVLLCDERPKAGVIVEAQLKPDGRKRYSWPAYATVLRQRHGCPTCVLVVTPYAGVAKWAAVPIELGFGSTFRPRVLGPQGVPAVTDPAVAAREPELAVLSALSHARGDPERALAVAVTALQASVGLEHGLLYYDLIMARLGTAAREALKNMDLANYEFQSEFARRYLSQGRAEGEANLVLRLLEKRFGPLPATLEERVRSAPVESLESWAERLFTADSLDEVFAEA